MIMLLRIALILSYQLLFTHGSPNQKVEEGSNIQYSKEVKMLRERVYEPFSKTDSKFDPVILNENSKYSQVFQDHILSATPFKGEYGSSDGDSEVLTELYECVSKENNNVITGDISLSNCPQMPSLQLPSYSINNYFFKLNVSECPVEKSKIFIEYLNHWPALIQLQPQVPTPAQQCPIGLHQIIFGFTGKKTKIRLFPSASASEFQPRFGDNLTVEGVPSHHYLFRKSGFPKFEQEMPEVSLGIDAKSVVKPKNVLPKYIEYLLESSKEFLFVPNSWLLSMLVDEPQSTSNAVDGAEAATSSSSDNSENTDFVRNKVFDGKNLIFRVCLVDASNLNNVRAALSVSASVDPYDNYLLSQLYSPPLSTTMEMSPQSASMRVLKEGRPAASAATATATDSSSSGNGTQGTLKPPILMRGKARGAAAGATSSSTSTGEKSGGFRDWQEQKKWDMLVTSLTVPSPAQPIVVPGSPPGRYNFTISWKSRFLPSIQDTTPFGFNISVCKLTPVVVSKQKDVDLDTTSESNETLTTSVESKKEQNEISYDSECFETLSVPRLLTGGNPNIKHNVLGISVEKDGEKDDPNSVVFSAALSSTDKWSVPIFPDSLYRVRLQAFFGDAASHFSPWSEIIHTEPISVPNPIPNFAYLSQVIKEAGIKRPKKKRPKPQDGSTPPVTVATPAPPLRTHAVEACVATSHSAVLTFLRPLDDGGLSILGYRVMGRSLNNKEDNLPSNWRPFTSTPTPLAVLENMANLAHTYPSSFDHATIMTLDMLAITVSDLFGNTTYEFVVTAYNSAGESPRSEISNSIRTAWAVKESNTGFGSVLAPHDVVIRGYGYHDRMDQFSTITVPNWRSFPDTTLVSLNVTAETLTILPPHDTIAEDPQFPTVPVKTIPGWRCHYGSSVNVWSEAVWVKPALANSAIENEAELAGKIAFVSRGDIPIVYKVRRLQAAGVVGVVVVDDGHCARVLQKKIAAQALLSPLTPATTISTVNLIQEMSLGFGQSCLPGADRKHGEGFAAHDMAQPWLATRIPVMFVHKEDAELFLQSLKEIQEFVSNWHSDKAAVKEAVASSHEEL